MSVLFSNNCLAFMMYHDIYHQLIIMFTDLWSTLKGKYWFFRPAHILVLLGHHHPSSCFCCVSILRVTYPKWAWGVGVEIIIVSHCRQHKYCRIGLCTSFTYTQYVKDNIFTHICILSGYIYIKAIKIQNMNRKV